jgi:MinD-like ATPase involved in chromosome partitioning or flagellar assembly
VKSPIRFDDSLPAFAKLVKGAWGDAAIDDNLFLRDVSGRLTFVVVGSEHSTEDRAKLASIAAVELGAYADGAGFSVATPDELFDDTLKDPSRAMTLQLGHELFSGAVHLIDRRMVGADWLRDPEPPAPAPARFVFTSLKGGVGRSTALCVLAAHLASQGRRVLAIDMDLEAPGLGNLLLPDGTLPQFGLLDYLVESEVGNVLDDQFFADLVGPSWLGLGRGRVDVIPALGQNSLRFPVNVLAKIARAYLAGSSPDGDTLSFSDRVRILVERFADPAKYDAILVDARAGLHETTASAIVGLGADVLLFGSNQPQTFAGFELLFSHLATLPIDSDDSWQARLHIIQSKAPKDGKMRAKFSARMGELLARYLSGPRVPISAVPDPSELKDTFEVEWTEANAEAVESLIGDEQPSPIVPILDDDQFRAFDPIADRDILVDQFYSLSFGQFLEMTEAVVASLAERGKADDPE